jgi:hypothetical protein
MKKTTFIAAAVAALLLCGCFCACTAEARQIAVPLRVDFDQVRQALVEQLYREPGEQVTLVDDGTGCQLLRLSALQVNAVKGRLRLVSRGSAHLGVSVNDQCVTPLTWNGFLEVFGEPQIDVQKKTLSIRIVESHIYDEQRQHEFLTGKLRDAVTTAVLLRLEACTVDLSQLVNRLLTLFPQFVPDREEKISCIMTTLTMSNPRVYKNNLSITLAFQIEPKAKKTARPFLIGEKAREIRIKRLERWDAFLTFVIKRMARNNPGPVRQELLNVLIDARYKIVEKLGVLKAEGPDPVPGLFVQAWARLKPIMQQRPPGSRQKDPSERAELVSIGDSLAALAWEAPQTGFEISDEGLRSLARVIDPASTEDPVRYDTSVDPELRRLLGFGEPLPPPQINPAIDFVSMRYHQDDSLTASGFFQRVAAWVLPAAAAAPEADGAAELNKWVPDKKELSRYLPLVRSLLQTMTEQTLAKTPLDQQYHDLYRYLVLATAWQESCWRQFVRTGDTVAPLTSSGGSVGLMQINQQVWRGIYDQKGLLGDIAYNGRAGGEILLHYLRDFAIGKGEHRKPGGDDNLARATYAAYNGGPSQLSRYRLPDTKPSLKKIDALWWQKYQAVREGREMDVVTCYE